MPPDEELMTVAGAWALYDLQERELWDIYAADPTYLAGTTYLAGEQLMRRRCERAVQNLRYKHGDENWQKQRGVPLP